MSMAVNGPQLLTHVFPSPYHKTWCIMICVKNQEYALPQTSLIILVILVIAVKGNRNLSLYL